MSQTQPEVRKLMSDIFGDSDSEDEAPLPPSSRPPATAPSSAPKVMAGVRRSVDDDNLFESDDDEDRPIAKKQRAASTKKESSKTTSSSSSSKGGKLGDESSDEYASEEEVERTAEDDKFIDGEDENAELLKEYEQDKQHFKDDRPEGSSKKGGKAHEPEGPAADVVTQVLRDIKGKRVEKLSEEQKQSLAQDLLYKMDKAAKEDEVSFLNRQPAVAKINMLETVRRILLIRELQHTLLEFDLLSVLKIWIEPKDSRELASLTVRSAVYDMLLRLPCQADHLKRSGIGKTVVALRKHRSEIPEHKAILKSIMEKWCRPIFSKSSGDA